MKKKIIFMIINMNVGGTEKALLNMILEMPKDRYDITILMLEEYGGFLNSIPREVRIEYLKGYNSIKDILNEPPHIVSLDFLRKGKVIRAFNVIFLHLLSKFMRNRSMYFKYVLHNYNLIDNDYDVAVAYAGPMDFISYFVVNKIAAKKKVQWIHFDITKISFNKKFSSEIYNKCDKVFVVSGEARDRLIDIVPSIKKKTEVFPNIISKKLIGYQAKEGKGFNDEFAGLRILTVGRLTDEKGQDIAIRVLARLISDGYKVKWYCVGEGASRKKYEKLIDEYHLKDKFVLLGMDSNPYPYIDQCDIYVQPSRHEGYCITLAEARCLCKPIVTTNFAGAKEQIQDERTGLIVNANEHSIYEAVKRLIDNHELRDSISENLVDEDFNSARKMKKIYEFL
ncbi:glycosyltransferase [Bacillus cereus]|uniref:glycosyltransferase n=1 Tax=Bacillus cereus TaxID=1396 RepID=UPI0028536E9B|nr:glycosyltransferase [Bacillus cereus]MDR4983686.1 glycosyltransferase [Bacillus cereus]MEA1011325.1 glycosyltransferase [Bacillus cereus]